MLVIQSLPPISVPSARLCDVIAENPTPSPRGGRSNVSTKLPDSSSLGPRLPARPSVVLVRNFLRVSVSPWKRQE